MFTTSLICNKVVYLAVPLTSVGGMTSDSFVCVWKKTTDAVHRCIWISESHGMTV